ncbi:MAG TPA: SLBB domain-containing protein [Candidatus Krumholzibacteria bacterium]|nr:SLBB domain-containing protein [Candidatus Krumholzibacteria bacterium]
MRPLRPARALALAAVLVVGWAAAAVAQSVDPALLEEAARRTGKSPEELMREYRAAQGGEAAGAAATAAEPAGPGRTSLEGIDDRRTRSGQDPTGGQFGVILPGAGESGPAFADADSIAAARSDAGPRWFGEDFFRLDAGLFEPPSFGPAPDDYRLGVGDEVIVDVWGEVEMRQVRVVDRDGAIILPQAGQIVCAGRTLAEVDTAIRQQLARSHASIGRSADDPKAKTFLQVTLGRLRPIRVFVVGEAARPGSYEVNSVSTVLTALYAAGGPAEGASLRHVRLVRDGQTVGELDLYAYLLDGDRSGDLRLREGDTVHVAGRTFGVAIDGAVRRPMHYEMKDGETIGDLVRFAGGLTATASPGVLHVERILAPGERRAGQADRVIMDVPFDAVHGAALDPAAGVLRDGDRVSVDGIADRLDRWVEVRGLVKRPGRFQLRDGMTVKDLVAEAEGLWPDALLEWASLDRTSPAQEYSTIGVPLGSVLAGNAPATVLQSRDVLTVYARWDLKARPRVSISGEVHDPVTLDWRAGMTLRDLVLRAGGLKASANPLRAEISRIREAAVASPDTAVRPQQTVDVIRVELGDDFMASADPVALMPWDRVAIRRLPWWESQQTVSVGGEVFYPGEFSLESKGETLSSVVVRAGGLKPTAYAAGARVVRQKDGVGNVAIDLAKALADPGSDFDIILEPGDRIVIPNRMYTVKVTGEVGFPTSLVWQEGRDIDWYVQQAGGYLRHADKGRTRVVHPNGRSLPNKGSSEVLAGSTIVVPLEPPPEGRTTLEVAKDITAIIAGLATVWLVIDNTGK